MFSLFHWIIFKNGRQDSSIQELYDEPQKEVFAILKSFGKIRPFVF